MVPGCRSLLCLPALAGAAPASWPVSMEETASFPPALVTAASCLLLLSFFLLSGPLASALRKARPLPGGELRERLLKAGEQRAE